jgi:hypothetical protein
MDRLRELVEGEAVKVCEGGRGDRLILESIEAGVGDEVRRKVVVWEMGDTRPATNISGRFDAADMKKCNYCNRDRMKM